MKSLMCANVRAVSCHDFVANVRICFHCLQLTQVCEAVDTFTFKIINFQMLEVTSCWCRGYFRVPRFFFLSMNHIFLPSISKAHNTASRPVVLLTIRIMAAG